MLQKVKEASIPLPGGCSLGDRKYDIHIDALSKMGAQISEEDGKILGKLNDKFSGRTLTFHTATTSGTENVIIAGVLAKGLTIVENAHTCPEVIDLINFLNSMGANIKYSARYIEIQGVDSLGGGEYRIMNDKDEALTYMILAAALRSSIRIKDFDIEIVPSEASLLREIGVDVFQVGRDCFINSTYKGLKPFHLATSPYPGIVDAQPLFAALALTIQGESIITEMRHSSRFQYVEEFKKFGGDIKQYHNCIVIRGVNTLIGTKVTAPDLRAGAALIIIGALAQNETTIDNEYQIERGYDGMRRKLEGIGISCVLS
jgi:UDP-N-acetylglucosamine 1-carboxyvinyltransferase